VRVLDNRTTETGLEALVTDGLVREFGGQGNQAGAARGTPVAALTGAVARISEAGVARKTGGASSEREVSVTVRLTLAGGDGRLLVENLELTEKDAYAVMEDKDATTAAKRKALAGLSMRLARKARHEIAARLAATQ
jgi:hypothetical protein